MEPAIHVDIGVRQCAGLNRKGAGHLTRAPVGRGIDTLNGSPIPALIDDRIRRITMQNAVVGVRFLTTLPRRFVGQAAGQVVRARRP